MNAGWSCDTFGTMTDCCWGGGAVKCVCQCYPSHPCTELVFRSQCRAYAL